MARAARTAGLRVVMHGECPRGVIRRTLTDVDIAVIRAACAGLLT